MKEFVFPVAAAAIGAVVGSFLNVCIYRLPRGISLSKPRRSFCPSCERTIPWFENVPVFSWVMLRGKCSACGAKIPFRCLLVECLTAALFVLAWNRYGLPLAPVYAIFLALLIVAALIDIEHFIIPDEISWGGTAAGLLLSSLFPQMMQTPSRLEAFGFSLGAAVFGFALLWLVVESGKLAFGNKRHHFEKEEPFALKQNGDAVTLQIGTETLCWEDIFARESDELVLECGTTSIAASSPILRFRHDRMIVANQETPLGEVKAITGTLRAIIIPREAMGFGDVKFIAAIGAFLGWKAVVFSLCTASIVGCLAALAGIFLARDRAGARVPFGPFLALGAAIWLFVGEEIWNGYFGIAADGSGF
jgi:leader peptidase (prepilin peptidase) / N-methyltransferase